MNMNIMDASDLYLCLVIIRRLAEEQYQYVMHLFNMCKLSIIAENENSLMFRKKSIRVISCRALPFKCHHQR